MVPRALPWAMGHVSLIGPVTTPAELLVTSTTSGSPAALAWYTALQVACDSARRMFETVKYPLKSSVDVVMWTYAVSAACPANCIVGERRPLGKTVWS